MGHTWQSVTRVIQRSKLTASKQVWWDWTQVIQAL